MKNTILQTIPNRLEYFDNQSFNMSPINNGDINNDNTINVQDIILVVNLVLSNQFLMQADLNFDQVVDILDIVQIVNTIL